MGKLSLSCYCSFNINSVLILNERNIKLFKMVNMISKRQNIFIKPQLLKLSLDNYITKKKYFQIK